MLLPAAGQQSKTATQASVKTPSTTVTSSSTSTPGKPGTSTSAPAAATAKPQEPAKKKLEKVDLNAVSSALVSVFADFEQVMYGTDVYPCHTCLLRHLQCFDSVGRLMRKAYRLIGNCYRNHCGAIYPPSLLLPFPLPYFSLPSPKSSPVVWWSTVSSPTVGRGGAQAPNNFGAF